MENKTLNEIIAHFNEIAGRWNGDEPKGEDEAMLAKDIVDTAESLKGQIENYDF